MGFYQKVENHEETFANLPFDPIMINDFSPDTKDGRDEIARLLTSNYNGDTLDNIPKCKCGVTRGMSNLKRTCTHCGTIVEDTFDSTMDSIVWIAPPAGIRVFMNPVIWIMLNALYSRSGLSFIAWFASKDYKYPPDSKFSELVDKLTQHGFKRGWNYFVDNYTDIITFLHQNRYGVSKSTRAETQTCADEVYQLVTQNYEATFTSVLPIPNRRLFVIEKNAIGKTMDPSQPACMDAIRAICSVSTDPETHSPRIVENRVLTFHTKMAEYYDLNFRDVIGGKHGMARHHIFGSRLEFTARGVITSIVNSDWDFNGTVHKFASADAWSANAYKQKDIILVTRDGDAHADGLTEDKYIFINNQFILANDTILHDYDECHLPYTMAVGLFKIHLQNKLIKRGYSPREITRLLAYAAGNRVPMIVELLQELIEESPYGTMRSAITGIPIVLQRNPTLDRLSAQLLYVTKIKTELIEDNTIGLSVLVLTGPNADFDGDALNLLLITDKVLYNNFYNMSTHIGIHDLHIPKTVSNIVKLPSPTCSTAHGWLTEYK